MALAVPAVAVLLAQILLAGANPNYGVPDDVAGTGPVMDGVSDAGSYLQTMTGSQLAAATITQTVYGLPTIVETLRDVGTLTASDGGAVVETLTTLAEATSGDPVGLFVAAQQSINKALDDINVKLPGVNAKLMPLIGNHVPDRFLDGFGRLQTGLQALRTHLGTLKGSFEAAISQAGSSTSVPPAILRQHVTLRQVYDLAKAVRDLHAYLPVVRYTLNTSLEDAAQADEFLTAYTGLIAAVGTLVNGLLRSLSDAQDSLYREFKMSVQALDESFGSVRESIQTLSMSADPQLSATVDLFLSDFATSLADSPGDIVTVASDLTDDLALMAGMVATTDPQLLSVGDSTLIGSLVHTLINCGPYSRYCFQKFRPLVASLIELLLHRTSLCTEKEVPRLASLATAVQSILELGAADFEDVPDVLLVCDEMPDEPSRSECVSKVSGPYTTLGVYFADKYQLTYDLLYTELDAIKQRVRICTELAKRSFTFGEIPQLRASISACAANGPAD